MGRIKSYKRYIRVGGACLAGLVLIAATPASAQSFFDLLFGGGARRSAPQVSSYADPSYDGRSGERRTGGGGYASGGKAYCVRLCDGRHFPISGGNSSEICKSFCPASPTKVFSGAAIDSAYASDGKRYSDIPNAFVYRDKLVADCTCDGKSPTGLVQQNANDDPTLRPGDIVATDSGLMAYRGDNRRNAQFSPIGGTPGLSGQMRQQLSLTRVLPQRTAEEMKGAEQAATVSRNIDQRSQAAR